MFSKFFALFCCILYLTYCQAQTEVVVAVLKGTNNALGATGIAKFWNSGNGYMLNLTLTGVNTVTGNVGIHVHTWGDISDQVGAVNAGLHYNPFSFNHGCPGVNATGTFHKGDLGNVLLTNGGLVTTTLGPFNHFNLSGPYSYVGHTFIVHAGQDNCAGGVTGTGSSGVRYLQGVLGIANAAGNTAGSGNTNVTVALCEIVGTTGNSGISGRVMFTSQGSSTLIQAYINGIVGEHGFHVHAYGDLSDGTGTAAGGHFDPTSNFHGIPNAPYQHVGDMGNIFYYDTGVAYYSFNHPFIALSGTNGIIGHAVVVHQKVDDCSQPLGNAGSRYAFCVVGIADASTGAALNFTIPGNVPASQDASNCSAMITTAPPLQTTGTLPSTSSASFLFVSFFVFFALFSLLLL